MLKHNALTACCILLLIHALPGQQATSFVYGQVVEAATKDPLEYAAIILKHIPDSQQIRTAVSDAMGKFTFKELSPGHYFIEANLVGFEPKKTSSFELEGAEELNAGIILLTVSDFLLEEVEITASNTPFANGLDRKIYYPESDIQSQSGSASDMLQNIPSVTVEAEGDILLRGSSNITFLLNGKPSGL